jgi:hypothetical protein
MWRLLKNLTTDLPYDPAQFHSWGYTQKNVTQVTPEAPAHPRLLQCYSQLPGLETARMPTTDQWIKKMCYLYTMEFYSAMKNEILLFSSKRMELENITLSEVSLAQKTKKSYILPHMRTLDLGQIQQCCRTWVTR